MKHNQATIRSTVCRAAGGSGRSSECRSLAEQSHQRTISRLSTEYVAALLCEGVAETGLDVLDFAVVLVVSAGNIGRLKTLPAAKLYDHGSDGAVPVDLMSPTSLSTIAESLKLSQADAIERTTALVDQGILIRGAGGFLMGAAVNSSSAAARLADKNVAMARRFAKQMHEVRA
jgi:hypothetical protein